MPKKYYAVKKGRQTGIYTTWPEAQKVISGFSNAEFKSFVKREEAERYMTDTSAPKIVENDDTVIAYVDGSFDKRSNKYSYGVVLIKNGQVIDELSNSGDDPTYAESYQIAGECFGALNAIKWAIEKNYHSIIIHYDYLGIEMWALGKWRANKKVSQDYVTFFKSYSKDVEVSFVKVKAHSGIDFNERADQLAKDALR